MNSNEKKTPIMKKRSRLIKSLGMVILYEAINQICIYLTREKFEKIYDAKKKLRN
jgi:hypothetical protein